MEKVRKLKVKDVMRDVKSVKSNTSITKLIAAFEKEKSDAVAVVDEKGDFIGDVHKRDLLKLLVDPQDISWDEVVGPFGRILDVGYFASTVKDLMRTHEITVSPEDKVEDVVRLMFRHGLEVVPVVEEEDFVGMITELEILEHIYKHKKSFKRGKNNR
ncbi:MAG: CBS domain-containing protein [Candidatus Undinarchaeales archaeon]